MANKLRVFISSTMEDMGNERRAVANQLESMGFDPIRAETMMPNGESSWDTIEPEIEHCHLFVLILGERYGWEPDKGYGAGTGFSVTHLELNAARAHGKVILPFLKRLTKNSPKDEKRDALRREISDWTDGVFRQEFMWADELASSVGKSMTALWTNALAKDLLRRSDRALKPLAKSASSSSIFLPQNLTGSKVLLAGAGMSIAAGYPTALLLMSIMAADIWSNQIDSAQLMQNSFSDLAEYYETLHGRQALETRIVEALNLPQTVLPTPAHNQAVRTFKAIVTTNYDELFELACQQQSIKYRVVHPFDNIPDNESFQGLTIFKIVGSISDPHSLILTSGDLLKAASDSVFSVVKNLLSANELVVIGHSLRDGNIQKLLAGRDVKIKAEYVSPFIAPSNDIVLSRYGLKSVQNTADEYMTTYSSQIQTT